MKNIHFLLATLLIFLANLTSAQYMLTLDFEQMDPYLGKRLISRVVETSSGKEVGRKTIDAIETTTFSFDLYVLLHGRSYTVDYYVDVNGSGDYDMPPTDHAWQRSLKNAKQHTTLTFMPDKNYTDTGLPDPFPYSTYDGVWGGKWFNQTFGSTDSIEGLFQLTCDSFYGYFTTAGVFGNPAQLEFDTSGVLPDDTGNPSDTIVLQLDPPWTGQILVINEEIHADLMNTGVGLQFTGTIGAKRILCLYTVFFGGNPFANGYFYLRELDIESNTPELTIELTANAEVSCFDGDNGFLSTNAIGGMPGYAYSWSNGETTALIQNLEAGDYTVTITDSLGFTAETTYSVSQPEQIVTTWNTIQVSCNGLCDGMIDITMIGGVIPYTFLWSNGLSSEDASDLCAGTYFLTITDGVGCVVSAPITVFEPPALVIEKLVITDATQGQSNGAIEVTSSGGTGNLLYSLEGLAFQASPVFLGLPPGVYCVLVQDENGCMAKSDTFLIQDITAVQDIPTKFTIHPNPVSDRLKIDAEGFVEVEMLNIQSHLIRQYEKAAMHIINVDDFVPGMYVLRVSDGQGMSYWKVIVQ